MARGKGRRPHREEEGALHRGRGLLLDGGCADPLCVPRQAAPPLLHRLVGAGELLQAAAALVDQGGESDVAAPQADHVGARGVDLLRQELLELLEVRVHLKPKVARGPVLGDRRKGWIEGGREEGEEGGRKGWQMTCAT